MNTDSQKEKHRLYMRHLHETNTDYILRDVYYGLRKRCLNAQSKTYARYGGRGIMVCDQWKDSFHLFKEWAYAAGWKPGLEIDRVDNDGHYSPENCRCVSKAVNARNKPLKLSIEAAEEIRRELDAGETGPVLAKRYGVHHSLIYRIRQNKIWNPIPSTQ